jgi:cytidylate kinase
MHLDVQEDLEREYMSVARMIAIDGPASSGKSTVAKLVAERLGYLFFDTGVMYRAATLAAFHNSTPVEDETLVSGLTREAKIDVRPASEPDGRPYDVWLNGEDVTWKIRSPEVDANVSLVSSYGGVREALTRRQREIGLRQPVVMVGRDIGTVVLPEAECKIYLDASVEERARRRYEERCSRGEDVVFTDILERMKERDRFDSSRDLAPLKAAKDATILDTTGLNIEQVVDAVIQLAQNRREGGCE